MAHGKRYRAAREFVSEGAKYNLDEAVALLKKSATAKFDESVDVAFRLGVNPKQSMYIKSLHDYAHPKNRKSSKNQCTEM